MADRTARVVVGRAIFVSAWSGTSVPRDERGHAWDRIMSDGLRSPWTSQADAVLAALGIDPDTPTDDVKAGVIFLRMSRDSFHNEIVLTVNPDDPQQQDERPWWVAESHAGIAYGLSPAAAVLALAARLEEQ